MSQTPHKFHNSFHNSPKFLKNLNISLSFQKINPKISNVYENRQNFSILRIPWHDAV